MTLYYVKFATPEGETKEHGPYLSYKAAVVALRAARTYHGVRDAIITSRKWDQL